MRQILFIFLFQQIISYSLAKNKLDEIEKIQEFVCRGLRDANAYRAHANWQKLGKIDVSKVPKEKFDDFLEWQTRYASVERYLKYCEYLQNCMTISYYRQTFYEDDEKKALSHVAVQPQFSVDDRSILPIDEAMHKIVTAYQIIFANKTNEFVQKCVACCVDKKQMPKIHFRNKENCLKVFAWAMLLESDKPEEEKAAVNNLQSVKQYLLSRGKLMIANPPMPNRSENDQKIRTNSGYARKYDVIHRNFYASEQRQQRNAVDHFIDELQFQLMLNGIIEMSNHCSTGGVGGSGTADSSSCFFDCCCSDDGIGGGAAAGGASGGGGDCCGGGGDCNC